MASKKRKKKSKTKKTKLKNTKGTQVFINNVVERPSEVKKTDGFWSVLRKLASVFVP